MLLLESKKRTPLLGLNRWTLTKLIKATDWHDEVKFSLTLRASVVPWIYGLPKLQKAGCPLRRIVNTIGSPTYALSQLLASLLKPQIQKTSSAYVKNSAVLVDTLDNLRLAPSGDIMLSLDMVCLYTMDIINLLTPFFPASAVK